MVTYTRPTLEENQTTFYNIVRTNSEAPSLGEDLVRMRTAVEGRENFL